MKSFIYGHTKCDLHSLLTFQPVQLITKERRNVWKLWCPMQYLSCSDFLQSLELIRWLSSKKAITVIYLRDHEGIDHRLRYLNRQAFPDRLHLSQLVEARWHNFTNLCRLPQLGIHVDARNALQSQLDMFIPATLISRLYIKCCLLVVADQRNSVLFKFSFSLFDAIQCDRFSMVTRLFSSFLSSLQNMYLPIICIKVG